MYKAQSFGLWLKKRRKELDLTQEALAEQAGYSAETIKKIENGALRPSRLLAERLAEILEIPSVELAAFVQWARKPPQPTSPVPQTASRPLVKGLPIFPDSLIGREKELSILSGLLKAEQVRLLTLTGTGGTGKTRLATQLANDLASFFPEGVYFVSLAGLNDAGLVLSSLAETLGVEQAEEEELVSRLSLYLRNRKVLLILDNFEHLLPAAPRLSSILERTEGPKFLVTSRARLNLRWEREFEVPPLTLPDLVQIPDLTTLEKSAAVRLFVERASNGSNRFSLTPQNGELVAKICHRLEGLPLALELAAARIKLLPPASLLARLERRLVVLTVGPADLPLRQQTLRNAISWSYDLLNPSEQRLFRTLGVFAGGCSVEAVEQVFVTANSQTRDEVLDLLATLVNHSLLRWSDQAGFRRFYMLETLREFALEQLEVRGEQTSVRNRHLEWCLTLAETYNQPSNSVSFSPEINKEQDNLWAALAWGLEEGGDRREGLRLAANLRQYWERYGHEGVGRKWVEKALSLPEASNHQALRADLLLAYGQLAWSQSDLNAAARALSECVLINRELGQAQKLCRSLLILGALNTALGELETGRELLEESRGLAEQSQDNWLLAGVWHELGVAEMRQGQFEAGLQKQQRALRLIRRNGTPLEIAGMLLEIGNELSIQGDYAASVEYIEEGLAIAQEDDLEPEINQALYLWSYAAYRNRDYVKAEQLFGELVQKVREQGAVVRSAWILNHLGDVNRAQGREAEAQALYHQALAIFEQAGEKQGIGAIYHNLGYLALHREATNEAQQKFELAFNLFVEMNNLWCIGDSLIGLAGVKQRQGQPEAASRLLGAASRLHTAVDSTSGLLDPANRDELEKIRKGLEAVLEPAVYKKEYEKGQVMSLKQIVTLVLGVE
jgi:predicted ATPase/transcriptional regulator with XRE-family HTH domain/TolA-binding protein